MSLTTQPAFESQSTTAMFVTAANSYWGSRLSIALMKLGYKVVGVHNTFFKHSVGERVILSIPGYQHISSEYQLSHFALEGIVLTEMYLAQTYPQAFTQQQTDELYLNLQTQLDQLQTFHHIPLAILASYRQLQPHKHNPNYAFNSYLFQTVVKYCVTHNIDYRVIFMEDLVAKNMPLSPHDSLHQLLQKKSRPTKQSINLHYRCYPLSPDDASVGIIKALFAPHTFGKNLLLAGNAVSLSTIASYLSLKHHLSFPKKANLKKMHTGIVDEQLSLETRRLLKWKPKISSLELMHQIGNKAQVNPNRKSKPYSHTSSSSSVIPFVAKHTLLASRYTFSQHHVVKDLLFNNFHKIGMAGIAVIGIFIIPFLVYSFFVAKSVTYAYLGYRSVKQGDWHDAKQKTMQAVTQLQTIDQTQPFVEKVQQVPISKQLVRSIQPQLSLYSQLVHTLNHFTIAGESANNVVKQALVPHDSTSANFNLQYLNQLTTDLSILETQLPSKRPKWLIPFINDTNYTVYLQQIPTIKRGIQQVAAIAPIAEYISAQTEPLTLAVLLQNNSELRPTGGFIGSFALLNFESGTITQKKIYDVYDADGQLKGYVKPPQPIETHLGEASWYLRDANWDPDFPTTAERVQWFIQKELNTQVDGVVAIDLIAITNVLQAVGPLNIPDIPVPISHENILSYLQTEIETEFFPGSHRKKYLLTSISEGIISQLKNLDRQQTLNLATNLQEIIQEKHLQIWFADQQLQQQIQTQPWSGELTAVHQPAHQNDLTDQIRLIESNLGVNKANQFIDRSIQHTLDFDSSDRVEHTIRINYFNHSTQETKIEGPYKNYLRAYIPLHARIDGALILRTANNDQGREVNVQIPEPVDSSIEHEQQVTGFLVTVAPRENVTVEIKYSLPLPTSESEFTYRLSIPKQFGLGTDPYRFKIITGKNHKLLESAYYQGSSATSLTSEPVLTYNTELSTDQQLYLKLTKK